MDFLQLGGKTILVFGVANRKSVAWHIGQLLDQAGAKVVYVVRSEARQQSLSKLLPNAEIHVCDVEFPEQIEQLRIAVQQNHSTVHGLLHSIAFADYGGGPQAVS